MKKLLSLLLITALLLSGCGLSDRNIKDPVEFYYHRDTGSEEYKTYFSEGAVGSELREASGHKDDLFYLISMYLRGPLDPNLSAPFPTGTALVTVRLEDRTLLVNLSSAAAGLDEIDLTIACACLAKTCLNLTDADAVRIEANSISGSLLFSRTVTEYNLILTETTPAATEAAENNQ